MAWPPDTAAQRADPIASDECDVTVVGGAGHVGVPLVLAMADAGLRVNVNDTNGARIDMLRAGCPPFMEEGAEAALKKVLLARRLAFSLSSQGISKRAPVIVTISTPSIPCARWCRIALTISSHSFPTAN